MNMHPAKSTSELSRDEAVEALEKLRAWAKDASPTEIAELDPAIARLLPGQEVSNYPELARDYPDDFVVDAAYRLPQLNVVAAPAGVDEAAVRKQLLSEFNLEIGAGLGVFAGKVWRIGLMGYAARKENVQLCVSGLRHCLGQ